MTIGIESRNCPSLLTLPVVAIFAWMTVVWGSTSSADERRVTKWDDMIDAVSNRNPPPDLVKVGGLTLPLFSPSYDWEEQNRVRRAFVAIARNDSPELWERLIDHLGDRRYSLTLRDNNPNAENYSVGDLCRIIAEYRLFFVSQQRSNPNSRERADIYLDVGIKDLANWRKQRSGKSLYELQIDICENAIKQISSVKNLSEKAKTRIRARIDTYVDQLKRKKKPLFFEPHLHGYEFFDSDEASKVSDRVKRGAKRSGSKKNEK